MERADVTDIKQVIVIRKENMTCLLSEVNYHIRVTLIA